jgi:predicted dehydrogenase
MEHVFCAVRAGAIEQELVAVVVRSDELVSEAGEQFGNPEEERTSAVGSHYRATASEDSIDFVCTAVTVFSGVCNSVGLS